MDNQQQAMGYQQQGMNPQQSMSEPQQVGQCFSCHYEGAGAGGVCPRCGKKKFITSESIRTRGIVVMICGLVIAGLMGAVAVGVGLLLMNAMNDPSSARKITEEGTMLVLIYAFFGLLIVTGLYFFATGFWMFAFRKRNRVMIWIMWAMIAAVVVGGIVLRRVIE